MTTFFEKYPYINNLRTLVSDDIILKEIGSRADEFEVSLPKNPVQVDFCGEPIELREFIKVLSIGDRIRVLCDDGLLVAEKISETQCKVIHSEMMDKLVQ